MAEKLAHDLEWIADRPCASYLRTVFATGWRVLKQCCEDSSVPTPEVRRVGPHVRDLRNRVAGRPHDPERLAAMSATLVHRGPTAAANTSTAPSPSAHAGFRSSYLAGGDQTITSEDGACTVGTERRDLQLPRAAPRARARRPPFRSRCDTGAPASLRAARPGLRAPALPEGCSQWRLGRAATPARARARPVGIKPLYYRPRRRRARVRLELRALPRGEIDLDALEAFLAFNSIPSPYSIFREIRKLPPGHVLVWEEDGAVQIERYARPGPVPAEELRTDDEADCCSRSCVHACATRCARTSLPTFR